MLGLSAFNVPDEHFRMEYKIITTKRFTKKVRITSIKCFKELNDTDQIEFLLELKAFLINNEKLSNTIRDAHLSFVKEILNENNKL